MLTTSSLQAQITALLTTLEAEALLLHRNQVAVIPCGQAHTKTVRWAGSSLSANGELEMGTIEEYCHCLTNGMYTAVMRDAALLQVEYTMRYSEIIHHRLAYLPFPLNLRAIGLEPQALRTMDWEELEELVMSARGDELLLRSQIRFDYDPKQTAPNHPAAHVHFMTESSRCPAYKPLSFGHFMEFVLSNYYISEWDNWMLNHTLVQHELDRCISSEHEQRVHVSMRSAPSEAGPF